jgi:hypothetical protein
VKHSIIAIEAGDVAIDDEAAAEEDPLTQLRAAAEAAVQPPGTPGAGAASQSRTYRTLHVALHGVSWSAASCQMQDRQPGLDGTRKSAMAPSVQTQWLAIACRKCTANGSRRCSSALRRGCLPSSDGLAASSRCSARSRGAPAAEEDDGVT